MDPHRAVPHPPHSVKGLAPRQLRCVLLVLLALSVPPTASAQETPADSGAAPTAEVPAWRATHTPRGALWRAAALPGWGQVYNRQYIKLPLVYGGLGGFIALALWQNDRYLLYRRAFLFKSCQESPTHEVCVDNDGYAQYADEASRFPNIPASQLRAARDDSRRNRDLSYFGIGLFYALTILDAYVSAHLLDFDIGEDLTVGLRLAPSPGHTHASVHVRF